MSSTGTTVGVIRRFTSSRPGDGVRFTQLHDSQTAHLEPIIASMGTSPHSIDLLPFDAPARVRRVLIVDDAQDMRTLMSRLLSRRGFDVVAAVGSSALAIEAVECLVPDAALLDVHLPDGDGFDLASRLVRAHPRIRILLTSARADACFHARAEGVGAKGFVSKAELGRVDFSVFW